MHNAPQVFACPSCGHHAVFLVVAVPIADTPRAASVTIPSVVPHPSWVPEAWPPAGAGSLSISIPGRGVDDGH